MIVVDASVLLDLLLRKPAALQIEGRLFRPGESLHAPHLIDIEIMQVLRRHSLAGELRDERAQDAIRVLEAIPLRRHPQEPLLRRIWELRHQVTAYDATYLALAESLEAPLVTRDAKLAGAGGHRARVELL